MAAVFAAAACANAPAHINSAPADAQIVLGGDACGARALQYLIGEDFATVRHEARFEQAQVQTQIRASTLEFAPHRLNVVVDASGRIAAVGCF